MKNWKLLTIIGLAACSTPGEPKTGRADQALTGPDAAADAAADASGSGSDPTAMTAGPTVATDKLDYQPGETAQISGSGFAPGETLTVQVTHIDGTAEGGNGHAPFTTVADASGAYATTWYVDADDSLGSLFRLTVDGGNARHAEMQFTDTSTTIVLNAIDTGWYHYNDGHFPGNKNYAAAYGAYRDYFVFDLGAVSSPVKSATLKAYNGCSNGTGTYTMYDVSTSVDVVMAENTLSNGRLATVNSVYADLGSGTALASAVFNNIPQGSYQTITFNQQGQTALTQARGRRIVIGGDYASPGLLFGCTRGGQDVQLTLTTGSTDNTPPVLTLPAPITTEATSSGGAAITYAATATDETDGPVVPTCTPASSSVFALGTTTVSCTANDNSGNTSTGSFTVTVVDTTKPTLSLPANITAEATSPAGGAVSFTATATDIVDGAVAVSCAPASGAVFPFGTTTVNCSATDAHHNTGTGVFSVTIVDVTKPVVTVPASMQIEATGPGGAQATFASWATDNIDGAIAATCSPASGSTFTVGTTTVTCSATDAHGNTGSNTFTVTVRDTTAPVLDLPPTIVAEATSAAGAAVAYAASAHDLVDGAVAVICAPASGSTFSLGTTAVSCSATDAHGNTATGAFSVAVRDTTPPELTLPAPITVEATGPFGATANYTALAHDLVDGDVAVTCSQASGSMFALHTTTVHCTATDAHGNTAAGDFTVTVQDTTPPAITPPHDIIAEATSAAGALVPFSATATDLVDGDVAVICTPAASSQFALGTTPVTCAAHDASGNSASASFTVTVRDTTPPAITVPAPISAEATGPAGAAVTYAASAVDLVDGATAVTCTPASGSTFALGATTVSCTSEDAHHNVATRSFTVTVQDTTPPVITVPANVVTEATGPGGATVAFAASAHDLVDGNTAVVCSPVSGSLFGITVTAVTCTSTDAHGNTAHGSFTVTVVDTTPPALALPANITAEATGPAGATVGYTASALDIVDGAVAPSCSQPAGSTFALGATTVTCVATDAHGNSASGSFTVTVVDTTPPAVTPPANQTIEATGPSGATATFAATATDLVDGATAVTCTPASGSTFALGTSTVTCASTDAHGNTGSATFTVTVRDTTPPALTLPSNISQVATSAAGNVVTFSATATDVVDGNVAVTCTPASGTTFHPGATTVSCSATDAHGNKASGTFSVTIAFSFSGFLQPINVDGSSVFKLGSTIPVKFQLTAASAPITNLVAKLYVAKVSNNVVGTDAEAVATGSSDTGNVFRYDATSNQYIFNMSTKSLSEGTWQISADLGDGVPRTVLVSLKR